MASERVSEDIRNFAIDLYDKIWTKHAFVSPVLEKQFTNKLSSLIVGKKKKKSNFTGDIGRAVFSSQYLLRSFCFYCFSQIGKDLTHSHTFFNICVYNVTFNWTSRRSDIFCKVIDSAAIIAEAILFCDAVLSVSWEIMEAAEMFTNFFGVHLRRDFFKEGGWKQLNRYAIECYYYLDRILEPFICSRLYKRLDYNCDLIRMLRDSPIMFPVECLVFCEKCTILPSDKIQNLFFDTSILIKLLQVPIDDYNEVWQSLESLGSKVNNLCVQEVNAVPLNFECRFLGGLEIPEQETKKPRKKRKRRPKNISKTNLDDEQINREKVDCLQYADSKKKFFLQSEESRTGTGIQNSSESKTDCLCFSGTKKTELHADCENFTELRTENCMQSVKSKNKANGQSTVLKAEGYPISANSIKACNLQFAQSKTEDYVQSAESKAEQNCAESKGNCVSSIKESLKENVASYTDSDTEEYSVETELEILM